VRQTAHSVKSGKYENAPRNLAITRGINFWGEAVASQLINFPPLQVTKSIQVSKPKLYRDRDFLHQKYVVERLSIKEISAEIFSSRTAVSSGLKRFGIPIRENDIAHKNRSQLRYGEAWRKRQVVAYRREQENIEKMRQLRSQGFSYWKIADVFNSMKIPTKTGRGRWHARAIQNILDLAAPGHVS
jgi:hypothetical protein